MVQNGTVYKRYRIFITYSSNLALIFLFATIGLYFSGSGPYRDDNFADAVGNIDLLMFCFIPIVVSIAWCSLYNFFLQRSETRTRINNDTDQMATTGIQPYNSSHMDKVLSPVTVLVVDMLIWMALVALGPGIGWIFALDSSPAITDDQWLAYLAHAAYLSIVSIIFMGVSAIGHFVLFVRGCQEVDMRNKARKQGIAESIALGTTTRANM